MDLQKTGKSRRRMGGVLKECVKYMESGFIVIVLGNFFSGLWNRYKKEQEDEDSEGKKYYRVHGVVQRMMGLSSRLQSWSTVSKIHGDRSLSLLHEDTAKSKGISSQLLTVVPISMPKSTLTSRLSASTCYRVWCWHPGSSQLFSSSSLY